MNRYFALMRFMLLEAIMDPINQRILELIRENARMSYSDIGKAVGSPGFLPKSAWIRWKRTA